MDVQLNRRYAFKYHVNNCRKWAGRISRDHTLQFAGKKGTTASMGSPKRVARANGLPFDSPQFLNVPWKDNIGGEKIEGSEKEKIT